MDFWHSAAGMTEVTLTSASPAETVAVFNAAGITVYDCTMEEDELTVRFLIKRKDFIRAARIAKVRGDALTLHARKGLYWRIKNIKKRPVLLCGLLILMMLVTFLPTRIYFFRVEGNETIPTNMILERAAACGISFGASRREVRSEKMKNALLQAIPELQWAGINTSGCTATISIRERSETDKPQKVRGVSSIVAIRDGIISQCTVTRGNASCKEGQAVRAGQVLICGYTDCGISIRAEQAQGEVYAVTERKLEAVLPTTETKRQEITGNRKKYSLIIGKKRINLSKDSGIPDTSCVKIYSEKYLTLPGGFQLPLAIATEELVCYTCEETQTPEDYARSILTDFSKDYLSSQMIAGRILNSQEEISGFTLSGKYACNEMIGVIQNEEIVTPYVKHD